MLMLDNMARQLCWQAGRGTHSTIGLGLVALQTLLHWLHCKQCCTANKDLLAAWLLPVACLCARVNTKWSHFSCHAAIALQQHGQCNTTCPKMSTNKEATRARLQQAGKAPVVPVHNTVIVHGMHASAPCATSKNTTVPCVSAASRPLQGFHGCTVMYPWIRVDHAALHVHEGILDTANHNWHYHNIGTFQAHVHHSVIVYN